MKKKDQILIARSLEGGLSKAEQIRLEGLLSTSAQAGTELDELHRVRAWLAATPEAGFAPGFSDRVLRRLHASADGRTRPAWLSALVSPAARRTLALVGGAIAAFVFALVGVTLWNSPTRIEVRYGDIRLVVLPDGSRVELGSGSTLTYGRFRLSSERRVQLVGEAYFDVVEEERPFSVETFNARLQVEGTEFNVRAWPNEPDEETTVTVTEGIVRLASRLSSDTIELRARQFAAVSSARPLEPQPLELPVERALAWRTGGLTFQNRTLSAALVELERRYNVTIRLADPALALERVTYLQPEPRPVTDVLSDISYSKNLQFRPIKDGFEVFRAE